MKFDIEDLDRVLKYKTIKVKACSSGGELFERNRLFKIGKNTYRIEWYCNISYLYCPGNVVIVPFQYAILSNTWPRRSKMNIQFYDSRDKVCCILKIDDYHAISTT